MPFLAYHFDRRNVKEEEMDIWHFSLNILPLWCCLIRNLAVNTANTTIILTECSDRDVNICFDLYSIQMMWYTSDVFICEKRVEQVAIRKYRAHSKRRQIILLAINFQSSKYLNAFLRRSFWICRNLLKKRGFLDINREITCTFLRK